MILTQKDERLSLEDRILKVEHEIDELDEKIEARRSSVEHQIGILRCLKNELYSKWYKMDEELKALS